MEEMCCKKSLLLNLAHSSQALAVKCQQTEWTSLYWKISVFMSCEQWIKSLLMLLNVECFHKALRWSVKHAPIRFFPLSLNRPDLCYFIYHVQMSKIKLFLIRGMWVQGEAGRSEETQPLKVWKMRTDVVLSLMVRSVWWLWPHKSDSAGLLQPTGHKYMLGIGRQTLPT